MSKVWRWLAGVWSRMRTRRAIGPTHADLMMAISEGRKRLGDGVLNDILAEFGGAIGRISRVERIAECIYAIQQTTIRPGFVAHAAHTRVGVSPHRGPQRLYEIVMGLWEPGEIFESATIRDMLVDMGYAPTSHGPCLSDLTQLGYLESGGGGLYAFTSKSPRGVDWTEEAHRLAAMRTARRRS